MTVGTKSLLFGVHAFWWHPIVVARAWRALYGRWPTLDEWVAIFVHDFGYFGCPEMDGPCGSQHPRLGARIARGVVLFYSRDPVRAAIVYGLIFGHSYSFAASHHAPVSALCAPDKYATCFEPWWWYWLRSTLSGELREYVANGPAGLSPKQWFRWLQNKFRQRYETSKSD